MMQRNIIGTGCTDAVAMIILAMTHLSKWLARTGLRYLIMPKGTNAEGYYSIYIYDADRENHDPLECSVYVQGDTIDNLQWFCSRCGGTDKPNPIPPAIDLPCRHVLMAWASQSRTRALQLAILALPAQETDAQTTTNGGDTMTYIVGTEWTDRRAIEILQTRDVCAWLVPDADTTCEICPCDPSPDNYQYHIIEWYPAYGDYDERCYYVHARGETIDTLIHNCTCGGDDTPYPVPPGIHLPCRHVLLAWGSQSVDRALQVADLCMRAWQALLEPSDAGQTAPAEHELVELDTADML